VVSSLTQPHILEARTGAAGPSTDGDNRVLDRVKESEVRTGGRGCKLERRNRG